MTLQNLPKSVPRTGSLHPSAPLRAQTSSSTTPLQFASVVVVAVALVVVVVEVNDVTDVTVPVVVVVVNVVVSMHELHKIGHSSLNEGNLHSLGSSFSHCTGSTSPLHTGVVVVVVLVSVVPVYVVVDAVDVDVTVVDEAVVVVTAVAVVVVAVDDVSVTVVFVTVVEVSVTPVVQPPHRARQVNFGLNVPRIDFNSGSSHAS